MFINQSWRCYMIILTPCPMVSHSTLPHFKNLVSVIDLDIVFITWPIIVVLFDNWVIEGDPSGLKRPYFNLKVWFKVTLVYFLYNHENYQEITHSHNFHNVNIHDTYFFINWANVSTRLNVVTAIFHCQHVPTTQTFIQMHFRCTVIRNLYLIFPYKTNSIQFQ